MTSNELVPTSNLIEDSVDCGCENPVPAEFSQEIAPEIGVIMEQQQMPIVTTAPATFSVGGATPTSVTFNFGDGYPGHMCEGKTMGGGKTLLEIPEAGIKIIKMGHGDDYGHNEMKDTDYCMYDEFGSCMTCGY